MYDPTPMPPDVRLVRVLDGRRVWLEYVDGTAGAVDLAPLLDHPFLARVLVDDELFAQAHVGQDGTVAWPGGCDLDPEGLHELARAHLRQLA